MEPSYFLTPKIYVATDTENQIKNYLEKKEYKYPALIYDHALSTHELVLGIINNLTSDKWELNELVIKEAEPGYDYLEKIRTIIPQNTDIIITLGGGSTLDCAKAVSLLLVNHEKSIKYRGFNLAPIKGAPIIAIPSTAGTGSEITPYAVFTDKESGRKLGINSDLYVPELVFL